MVVDAGVVITSIETVPVRAPLEKDFRGSHYHMTHRATLVTRVHTSAGIVGEAYAGDEDQTLRQIERTVHDEIAPAVVGLELLATERSWEAGHPATFDILRDRRIALVALAGVDAAIWDAVGKFVGQPLWRLWGGYRNRVPLIAIGGYYGEPLGPISEEIAAYQEMGLAGIKFKVGGRTPAEDAARVEKARAAAGDDFLLAIDANQGYTVPEALELCDRIHDLGITWFEEPVRWENDRRSLRDVRMRGGIPVCAGQSELSPAGCRDLMEHGAIDVCNFDSSWSGGPTNWLRAAGVAYTYDVRMGHHEEPQVATHLVASQPHGMVVECFHPARDPFWWNLVTNHPPLDHGELVLSESPGLGWALDQDYIERHRLRDDRRQGVADPTSVDEGDMSEAESGRAATPPPRVGMQQVAERAGVAMSSVSRVVSGHPDVSKVMRNRVLDAVAALGYEPDLLAQSLRRGATMTVGFVVGNIANPLFASIALGAELRLRNAGYTMLLANSIDDPSLDRTHIRLFAQRRVDGLMLSITDETDVEMHRVLQRAHRPTVLVDRDIPELHASAVLTDNAGGIELAAAALIALGHRRIALVNGNPQVRPARERATGLRRACRRAAGVSALVRPGAFTTEHGEQATQALLSEPRPPTAIIAGSNLILVGVLRALRRAGCSVPGDVSVVTCDDVLLLDFVQPPLATISRHPQEMGDVAAELLLELIAGGEPRTVVLPTEFTRRDSVAPPKG